MRLCLAVCIHKNHSPVVTVVEVSDDLALLIAPVNNHLCPFGNISERREGL